MSAPVHPGLRVRTSDGVELHVASFGDKSTVSDAEYGDGPLTVVLLHGWTLDHRLWQRQIAGLKDKARVLAVDLRGHGRSGSSELSDTNLFRLADDVHAVLTQCAPDGPVVLVGHSLGGMAVLEFAHRYPAEFQRQVKGVALVSTTAEGHTHTSYGLAPWLGKFVREVETRGAALLALGGPLRVHRAVMPALLPAVRWLVFGDRVELEALRLTIAMIGCASLRSIGGFRPSVGRMNRLDALSLLATVPVRVLVGNRDCLTPVKCTEAIVAALPHARLQVFDSCGHMLPLECPDAVTEALADLVTGARGSRRARKRQR
jgi:pimeloyl-ACP methyl ester carboxylesterase